MITLNEFMVEETLENWDLVNKKIDETKIFRFNYKKILGETLTEFITNREHLSNTEIIEEFFNNYSIKKYLNSNPFVEKKLRESVRISVSSRKAEHNSYNKRK